MAVSNPQTTSCHIAASGRDWLGACRLLHDVYVQRGLGTPATCGLQVTPWHFLPTTELFVRHAVGSPECESLPAAPAPIVATVTMVRDTPHGLPIESAYATEVAQLRSRVRLAEVTSLAGESSGDLEQLLSLFRLLAQTAMARGVEKLLIAVHPRHAAFYRRYTAFRPIGDVRPYHAAQNHPAIPLAVDLVRLHVDHPQVYQRFFGVPLSEEELAPRPMPKGLRTYLASIVDRDSFGESIAKAA